MSPRCHVFFLGILSNSIRIPTNLNRTEPNRIYRLLLATETSTSAMGFAQYTTSALPKSSRPPHPPHPPLLPSKPEPSSTPPPHYLLLFLRPKPKSPPPSNPAPQPPPRNSKPRSTPPFPDSPPIPKPKQNTPSHPPASSPYTTSPAQKRISSWRALIL